MSDYLSVGRSDQTMSNLERALDGAAIRQKVITNNIANVDTPGYKRSDVSFQDQLKQSMRSGGSIPLSVTNPSHMSSSASSPTLPFTVIQDTGSSFRNDGNNVDIERETVEMAKNDIYYNTAVQILNGRFNYLRYVIEEGK